MIVKINKSFDRDTYKIKNKKLLYKVADLIEDVRNSKSFDNIKHIKKIKGFKYHYRIRIGNYRMGVMIKGETIEFIQFLPRKDIYKKFP